LAEIEITIEKVGSFPPCFYISDFLWGKQADIDSDGNSNTPESIDWTELTLQLRDETEERIDIDAIEGKVGLFQLKASSEALARKTVDFLKNYGAIK
jgi:hypothetical protein